MFKFILTLFTWWILSYTVQGFNVSTKLWQEIPRGDELIDGFFSTGGHTNNWAVLVHYRIFIPNYFNRFVLRDFGSIIGY